MRAVTSLLKARLLFTWLALVLVCVAPQAARAQAVAAPVLGSNLNEVTDYSPQLPFINLFLNSRPWFTQCDPERDPGCSYSNSWDTDEASLIDLDDSGWVRSLPTRAASPIFTSVATYWDVPDGFPRGRYVVLYDGAGTLTYGVGAEKVSAESRAGRDVVVVTPSRGGILLRISATDPAGTGNYLRNIRFVAEEDEGRLGSARFSTHFLKQLEPYRALRFMDWMRTNGSIVSAWSARSLPTDARFSTERGVPLEITVELANTTGASPWFNIPHAANDRYVRNMATLVKSSLQSSLLVYVEYSNEVWNSAFSQGSWIQEQGEAEWPDSAESGFTKRINWHGKRSAEVCDIFKSVFSDDPGRVICVVGSQAANSWTAQEALSCPLWSGAPCASHGIGAVAIAPYFGDYLGQADNVAQVVGWTRQADGGLEKLFSELSDGGVLRGSPSGGAIQQSFEWIESNRTVANQFQLSLVAYEGGQHLVGVGSAADNDALTELFTQANRDSRMGTLYAQYLAGWNLRGGELFVHFTDIGTFTRYGSWGALERVGQLSSPKYDELKRYAGVATDPNPDFTLSVSRSAGGVISARSVGISCGTRCSATVSSGTQVTLTAQPRRGFRVIGWSGDCSLVTTRRCTLTVDAQKQTKGLFRRRR